MDSSVLQDVYEILSLELFWEGGLQAEAEERGQDIEEHVEYRQDQNEKRLQAKVTKVADHWWIKTIFIKQNIIFRLKTIMDGSTPNLNTPEDKNSKSPSSSSRFFTWKKVFNF